MQVNQTILPNIGDIWTERNLGPTKEVRHKAGEFRGRECPFCGNTNYKLYFNTVKNSFNCFVCGERGGVAKFIGLLDRKSPQAVIQEIKENFFNENGCKPAQDPRHPAEKLNFFQLKELGYTEKPNWQKLKEDNPDYAKRVMDMVWEDYKLLIQREIAWSVRWIFIYTREGKYQQGINEVKNRSMEVGYDLLKPALKALSDPNPKEWVIAEKLMVLEYENAVLNQKIASNGQKTVANQQVAGY